jgi:hypothetical protein
MHKHTVGRSRWTITRGGQAANRANVSVDNSKRADPPIRPAGFGDAGLARVHI